MASISALTTLQSTPVLILGLAREGFSTYSYLRNLWPEKPLWLFDAKKPEKLPQSWKNVLENDKNAEFFHEKDDFLRKKLKNAPKKSLIVFKSPGIPLSNELVQELERHSGVKVTSNTQLFFEIVADIRAHQPAHLGELTLPLIIGVTGTKGKSTTTSVIHHILKTNDLPAFLGGNIGVPPLDLLKEFPDHHSTSRSIKQAIFVLELSSHQLAQLPYSPHIAVIQDISPEHLDYYASFDEYVQAKSQITRYQTPQDYVVYNPNYTLPAQLAQLSPGEKITFSLDSVKTQLVQLLPLTELSLTGNHNLLNVAPGLLIGKLLGIKNNQLKKALLSFRPLPHRLEPVAAVNSVSYYNDSLSTTPESTIAALHSFSPGTVVLIAGGYDRRQNFSQLGEVVLKKRVKGLILLPTTGQRIKEAVIDAQEKVKNVPLPIMQQVKSMAEAVQAAKRLATSGDTVLMSPASASFNMFTDYADRGEQFKQAI